MPASTRSRIIARSNSAEPPAALLAEKRRCRTNVTVARSIGRNVRALARAGLLGRSYFNETYIFVCLDGGSFAGFCDNRTLDGLCSPRFPRWWMARRRGARRRMARRRLAWRMAWWRMEGCRLARRMAWRRMEGWLGRRLGSGRSTRRSCARISSSNDLGLSRLLCLPRLRLRVLLRPLPAAGLVARRMAVDQRVPLSEPAL